MNKKLLRTPMISSIYIYIYIYLKVKAYHLLLLYFCWAISPKYFQSFLFYYFESFYLFINFVVYDYIFSNFSSSILPFHLLNTININITLALSFYFPFILTSLIPSSNYKFVNLFHSIHILSHKKVITLFLSRVFLSFCFWQFF